LDYCAETLPPHLRDRVHLFRCNAQDVHRLPAPEVPYDAVFARGVFFHLLPRVFEAAVARLGPRIRPGGLVILSDPLYKEEREADDGRDHDHHGAEDDADVDAHRDHKTPQYYTSVLRQNGLLIRDMRVLPSNAEFIHWFTVVRLNIEANFALDASGSGSVSDAVRELHDFAGSFAKLLAEDGVSMYSIVAERAAQ
ncbi:hypothetical protein E4U41_005182, partial [Claviceps citrina]